MDIENIASKNGEELSESILVRKCIQNGGYREPELNETLYLNHFQLRCLNESLHVYTNCRVLYLNNNALSDLSAIGALTNLTSLYLSCNAIRDVSTLPTLPSLQLLDLSENNLKELRGVARAAPRLQILQVSRNQLSSLLGAGLEALADTLTTLDLSYNKIATVEDAQSVVEQLIKLRTLLLNGNGFIRTLAGYRKRCINLFPELRSLDGLPIFPDERERADAFVKGGPGMEDEVIAAMRARERVKKQAQMQYFEEVRKESQMRRELHGANTEDSRYHKDQKTVQHSANEKMIVEDDDALTDVYVPRPRCPDTNLHPE